MDADELQDIETIYRASGVMPDIYAERLLAEVRRLQDGIREHREWVDREVGLSWSTENDDALWSLLPEEESDGR